MRKEIIIPPELMRRARREARREGKQVNQLKKSEHTKAAIQYGRRFFYAHF